MSNTLTFVPPICGISAICASSIATDSNGNMTVSSWVQGACGSPPPPPPPPPPTPSGRQAYGDIGHSDNGSVAARGFALLQYASVANVNNGTSGQFPTGSPVNIIHNFRCDGYVALAFTAPATPMHGFFTHDETWPGANCDCTISTAPGDFTNPTASPFFRDNVGPGGRMATFKTPGSAAVGFELQQDVTYYLNIRASVSAARSVPLGYIINSGAG